MTKIIGFTLLELLIVLCIVGTVFSIGISLMSGSFSPQLLESKLVELYHAIHYGQQLAINHHTPYRVEVIDSGKSCQIIAESNEALPFYTISLEKTRHHFVSRLGAHQEALLLLPDGRINSRGHIALCPAQATSPCLYKVVYLENGRLRASTPKNP